MKHIICSLTSFKCGGQHFCNTTSLSGLRLVPGSACHKHLTSRQWFQFQKEVTSPCKVVMLIMLSMWIYLLSESLCLGVCTASWPHLIIRQHLHLQVVGVYGSWHLGQLQVGLSKARRLCQCSSATITTLETLAMQMDGEPWLQAPAKLNIELKGQAHMLRRLNSEPLARMAHTVAGMLHCLSATVSLSLAYCIGVSCGKVPGMQISHAQCSLLLPE